MNLSTLPLPSPKIAKQQLKTHHGRMIAVGLIVALAYFPVWLGWVGGELLHGSSYSFVTLGFLYLGLRDIFQYRKRTDKGTPSSDERWLGSFLILGALLLFFPLRSSVSLQALLFSVTIAGMIIGTWGFEFIRRHKLTVTLLFISFYPNLSYLLNAIRRNLTGSALEQSMAYLGSLAFQLFGQTSRVDGVFLFLADGAVEVASGCSGADMAFPIAGMAIVLGLLFNQSMKKIFLLTFAGIALALVFNVPRVMLLTIAIVHWGQESFDFWHGTWGGQIFSGILFTVYYYLFMWIVDEKPESNV